LESEMKYVTFNYDYTHEYLGMSIDFSVINQVTFEMRNKIQQLLEDYNINKKASTPATLQLFESRQLSPLSDDVKAKLRSGNARLLFLSINTHPDILLPVNFLETRVNHYNSDDWRKFLRIMYYLFETIDLKMVLKCHNNDYFIRVYADASYAVHSTDRRSQSGLVVTYCGAVIVARSGKQTLVTKSSTEVACSDSFSYAIVIKSIPDELNVRCDGIVLHQDNQSTIKLIKNNKPTSQRTRHIDTRYFFLRERVDTHLITVEYTPTEQMVADMLTKPLMGDKFKTLRKLLMNDE